MRGILLHPHDDVAVLLAPVAAGGIVSVTPGGHSLLAGTALPLGHKIALRDLPTGHEVRKHGAVIGRLTAPVRAGEHVHVHNLASARGS